MRHRLFVTAVTFAVVLLAPGLAEAANRPVAGTAEGKDVLVIVPGVATCVSPPAQSTDDFCKWNFRGTYSTGGPYLGSGKFSGRVTLNAARYAPNPDYGESCFYNFTGIVKFTNDKGTLRTVVDRASSYVCDNANGTQRDTHLVLTMPPGGNVGSYTNVTGGSFGWEGVWTQVSSTEYSDSATFGGVVQTT
ncbi:MAG: hypothetical protein ACJ76P_03140 [Actinomycetota bacterium]